MVKKMKTISNEIPSEVMQYAEQNAVSLRNFISYIEKYGDEIIQRTFAYKRPKDKELMVTEILRAVSGQKKYKVKNLYFTGLGGYQVVFEKKVVINKGGYRTYFDADDFDVWYEVEDTLPCIANVVLNPQLLQGTKYQYCAYEKHGYSMGLIDYLLLYNKYPHLELMSKLGIPASVQLLKKASKDKQFCKFLSKNKDKIHNASVPATIYAYNHNISIDESKSLLDINKRLCRDIPEIKDGTINRIKLKKYLEENKIGYSQYNDYLTAIKYLKLDLKDTKNIFPKEFRRMHDLRINEYESASFKKTLLGKSELNATFRKVAQEYSSLNLCGLYSVVIASDIKDLLIEGNRLHHCVGKMGYDTKMAKKESLILFVRQNNCLDIPFVTMEFSLKQKRIVQIYGDYDSKPSDDVLNFVNNDWLKHAKMQLKKIAI